MVKEISILMDPLDSIPMPRIDAEELNMEPNPSPTSSLISGTSLIQMHHGQTHRHHHQEVFFFMVM